MRTTEHYWSYSYPQGTFSVPTDNPQVFSADLVNALKDLTYEISRLRKLVEGNKDVIWKDCK